jgi:hypothetical protein
MKLAKILILTVALLSPLTAMATEDKTEVAQSVESLRLQLLEVESKEAALEARARQIDEDLKPENIERALAGIGSTRPEDLRELRRRELTIQKDSVSAQLKLLARSRERLESVLSTAETQAYQQSATRTTPALNQMAAVNPGGNSRWLFGVSASLIAIMGVVIAIAVIRKRST